MAPNIALVRSISGNPISSAEPDSASFIKRVSLFCTPGGRPIRFECLEPGAKTELPGKFLAGTCPGTLSFISLPASLMIITSGASHSLPGPWFHTLRILSLRQNSKHQRLGPGFEYGRCDRQIASIPPYDFGRPGLHDGNCLPKLGLNAPRDCKTAEKFTKRQLSV